MNLLAIDPGEKHCGVANFVDTDWHLLWAEELDPDGLFRLLEQEPTPGLHVVCEEYRLYPWLLQEQGFSEVRTAMHIGVIEFICSRRSVPLHMQSAAIKKPAAGIMSAFGLEQTGRNQHVRDAEMHGWYYILKEIGWSPGCG